MLTVKQTKIEETGKKPLQNSCVIFLTEMSNIEAERRKDILPVIDLRFLDIPIYIKKL